VSVNERLAALENQVQETSKTTWRVFEAVYGNGKPGLIADVQAIRQMLEGKEGHGRTWQWVISTLIAVAAVLVVLLKN